MVFTLEEFRKFTPRKETFALFGYPLGHTMSPELHADLFACSARDADYIAVSVKPERFAEAFALAKEKLSGFNCTIPHKKAVISLLDHVDKSAADLHSVNTVSIENGETTGYNTDILGFAASLQADGIKLADRKCLLVGYGGAAAVMGYHCVSEGAQLYITGRNLTKAEDLRLQLLTCFPKAKIMVAQPKNLPKQISVICNATPIGMFPNEDASPLAKLPYKIEYVFDAIYNPPVTALMKQGRQLGARTRDGLFMLVMQAAWAQTYWCESEFSDADCAKILQLLYAKMAVKRLHDKYGKQNIALCGFMGSGKTTFGKLLAKLTGLSFADADIYLEQKEGKSISQIFSEHGEAHFRVLETKYLKEISSQQGLVIALGGGAVLKPENVSIIKNTCFLIYLNPPFRRIWKNLISSKNRPLLDKQGENRYAETRKLYVSRRNVYLRVCDASVRSTHKKQLTEDIIKCI